MLKLQKIQRERLVPAARSEQQSQAADVFTLVSKW